MTDLTSRSTSSGGGNPATNSLYKNVFKPQPAFTLHEITKSTANGSPMTSPRDVSSVTGKRMRGASAGAASNYKPDEVWRAV